MVGERGSLVGSLMCSTLSKVYGHSFVVVVVVVLYPRPTIKTHWKPFYSSMWQNTIIVVHL